MGKYILVIDQVYNDLSVKYSLAPDNSFEMMVKDAIKEYPDHLICVKTHPDTLNSSRLGYLHKSCFNSRVKIIKDNVSPSSLLRNAVAVYTVSSQIGFEALIWGRKVRCYGMPFYAGWGLTEDKLEAPEWRETVSLEQLVYGALIKYPIYRDPEVNARTSIEETIEYIAFQKNQIKRFNNNTYYAYKLSLSEKVYFEIFY